MRVKNSHACNHDNHEQQDIQAFLPTKQRFYDKIKTASRKVSEIYSESDSILQQRHGERIAICAHSLTFLRQDGNVYKLHTAKFCRVRLCPMCQWRRSLIWQAKFYSNLGEIIKQTPNARWLFLTLTVRNCEVTDLRETINQMNIAWNKFRLYKEFKNVIGWTRTIEVTHNKENNTAHPHFHVVLMVKSGYFSGKNYVTHEQWCKAWQQALNVNYTPIVDIKAVKSNKSDNFKELTDYVLKYAVKPSDMVENPAWFLELSKQLFKLRFIAHGGLLKEAFKNVDYERDTEGDIINYQFNKQVSKYLNDNIK